MFYEYTDWEFTILPYTVWQEQTNVVSLQRKQYNRNKQQDSKVVVVLNIQEENLNLKKRKN